MNSRYTCGKKNSTGKQENKSQFNVNSLPEECKQSKGFRQKVNS